MGCHLHITADRFPAQGNALWTRVRVTFHYDTARTLLGMVVRDDMEPPYETLIRLDDGRYVRAAECQYAKEGQ